VKGKKNRITDLKSASKGVNQKNKFCRGNFKNKKKNYREVKQNSPTLHGGKDLLTLIFNLPTLLIKSFDSCLSVKNYE
jgi:hypothetical protein